MSYAAFDTQEFVETLEKSGVPTEQARAISSAVRKANDKSDVATKSDIEMVKRDIDDVQRNMDGVATKRDLEDVRKDMVLIRKDMVLMNHSLFIKLSAVMVGTISLASTIVTLVVKLV